MGRISVSVGLASGFPIQDTVDKLIELQATPRKNLETKNTALTNQQVALTKLTALMLSLQSTSNRLATASLYTQRTITSSNSDALSATVTGTPDVAAYQFTPMRVAQSQQLQSSRIASDTAPLGAGTFTLGFGGYVNTGVNLDLLNDGNGVARGKIRVTDRGGATADVDLSLARSVDDVLAAINNNTTIHVRAETVGDQIRLVDLTGQSASNLRVQEVSGTTAADLGLASIDAAASSATGSDVLNLFSDARLNTLNDGLGVRFSTTLADFKIALQDGTEASIDLRKASIAAIPAATTTAGTLSSNAKINFTAASSGTTLNDVSIEFIDNGSITAGHETVAYDASDPLNKKLTFQIDAGNTTADQIIAALNNDPVAKLKFTAARATGSNGTGLISTSDTAVTAGGANAVAAGNEQTLAEVITAINAALPGKVSATISGNGLVLTDLTSGGGTFAVTALNGSKAAQDLGLLKTASGTVITGGPLLAGLKTSLLSDLKGGTGLNGLGLISLTDRTGTTATVDLSSAQTLDDVIQTINGSGLAIEASYNTARNGLQIVDSSGASASNLIVASGDGLTSAERLGLVTDSTSTTVNGGTLQRQVVNENTTLASYYGGAGVSAGSFTITDSLGVSKSVTVDSTVVTVGDLIKTITNLGLNITARVNDAGDGIALVDNGGTGTLTVTEGGAHTARDLRFLTDPVDLDVGGTPHKAIDGSTTLKFTLDADDSLNDLVTRINAAGVPVKATTFNDGSPVKPFRFTLFSQRGGDAGALQVDTSGASFSLSETVAAQDALLLYGAPGSNSGVLTSSSTNTFTNVLPGVSLEVHSATTSPVTVAISQTNSDLKDAIGSIVSQFNAVLGNIKDITAYNTTTNQSAVLHGDGVVLRAESDLTTLVSQRFAGSTAITSLTSIGIRFSADGVLTFDTSKFDQQATENPDAIKDFLSKTDTGVSDQFKKLIDKLAGVGDTLIVGRAATLARQIENNKTRIDFLNARLEASRARMLLAFQRSEVVISRLQANLSALAALPGATQPTSTTTSNNTTTA